MGKSKLFLELKDDLETNLSDILIILERYPENKLFRLSNEIKIILYRFINKLDSIQQKKFQDLIDQCYENDEYAEESDDEGDSNDNDSENDDSEEDDDIEESEDDSEFEQDESFDEEDEQDE
ncbi:hypothetical protein [Clostridium oryzae]|uniref:Uncharacterized protein n=1 Tax=Clostridium oryzae TaxID=1450648 RepID=A0A1V4I844_9CLOT|nr:hypothetical protein [Clostridium oryzae]OPJ56141.1 hypothetical protein CLORY_43190 [Clostridium oryzae]